MAIVERALRIFPRVIVGVLQNTGKDSLFDAEERAEMIEEVWEEVDEGEMPLWFYLPLHPEGRLSPADVGTLRDWARNGSHEEG